MTQRQTIRSDIAWSTPTTITVKGYDLCRDILGGMSLGDMAFLELTDRLPTTAESVVFNAIAVTLVEPYPHRSSPTGEGNRLWRAAVRGDLQRELDLRGRPIA